MVINYAHRGASGYCPENTMASFRKAVELGCDGVETDVQMTSDGVMVLIHDEMVDRTTDGKGLVKSFSYKALRSLNAGDNEAIPTAEELLIFAKENNIRINFELKTGIVIYPGIEEKLIDMVYRYDMQNLSLIHI